MIRYSVPIILWSVVVTQLTTTEPARRRPTGSRRTLAGAPARSCVAVMRRPRTAWFPVPASCRRTYPTGTGSNAVMSVDFALVLRTADDTFGTGATP